MIKFSIIIPVYNVEKYIKDCLDSVLNQSYDNYEVIVVNDGSTDKSEDVIKSIKNDKIKYFNKDNSGVSDTRNFGISKCTGDYFIFVDSDDTINEDLLKVLSDVIAKKEVDLVKYQIQMIDGENVKFEQTELFECLNGEEAFAKLLKNDLFVTPVTYAYNLKYWKENNFMYESGRVHEDFGLTPIVVVKASSVTAIDYIAYNYYVRENSIMTSNSDEKLIRKNEDSIVHYKRLMKEIDETKVSDSTRILFKSYISNALINRCVLLDGDLLNKYIKELKSNRVGSYLMSDTITRKMKKLVFNFMPKFYIKKYVKR